MFGRGWKMDHSPFMLASAGGTEGLRRHRTTSRRFDGTQRDRYAKGRMCCGMIVCRFQLADGNQGDGGLCVIPGSHKQGVTHHERSGLVEAKGYKAEIYESKAVDVVCPGGTVVLFSANLMHGTNEGFPLKVCK